MAVLATLLPPPELQFIDANGVPYAGGFLYTYIPNTTTPKNSWIDSGQVSLNSNPIILDSAGRCTLYGTGSYTLKLTDSLGNLVYTGLTADTSYSGGYTTDSNPTIGTDFVTGNNGLVATQIPLISFMSQAQCRFTYTNSSTCTLSPLKGNNIVINSQIWQIPGAGVTISNSGLSTSTLYYIYAYINSGAIALSASTTGHSQQTGTGVEIMTGNAAYSLVGMVYIDGTGNFQDAFNVRYVRGFFNDFGISGYASMASTSPSDTITAVTPNYQEITLSSVPARAQFLLWQNERVNGTFMGQGSVSGASNLHTFMGVNLGGAFTGSSTVPQIVNDVYVQNSGESALLTNVLTFGANNEVYNGGVAVNEGLNYLSMMAGVDNSFSATFASNRQQTRLSYITVRR